MSWCCQATSHYLNQGWPSSVMPYGISRPGRPQWVSYLIHFSNITYLRPFGPSGIVHACVCLSVHVCVDPELVLTITHHTFNLASNLDKRYKTPWLRSLLFWGWLTLTSKAKLNFKSPNFSHFEFVCIITHRFIQARITKFGPKLQNTLVNN